VGRTAQKRASRDVLRPTWTPEQGHRLVPADLGVSPTVALMVGAVVAARIKSCGWRLLSDLMRESGTVQDPLEGWEPRRRASLERLWERFREAAGEARLSDELIAERRLEAAAADRADLRDEVVIERGFDASSQDGGPRGE
jgi:hypothetical protein